MPAFEFLTIQPDFTVALVGTECACQHCPKVSGEGSAPLGSDIQVPGPGSTVSHYSSGPLSCLGEAGTYQEGAPCRSSARSVLGPLRRLLLISHVCSMFSPCLAHGAHEDLPSHLLALECETAPSWLCQHLGSSCWHGLRGLGKVLHMGSRWWILMKPQGVAKGLEPNNLLPDRCASWLVSWIEQVALADHHHRASNAMTPGHHA